MELLEGLRGEDLSEPYRKAALERYFQLAAEASLDVGEMVIAREGFAKPETYRGILQVLGDEGILPEAFAERFEDVAGFRNVLVHDYTRIREEELVANLERLEDFRTFADHVLAFLEDPPPG